MGGSTQEHDRLKTQEHTAQLMTEGFTTGDWYLTLGFFPDRCPRNPEAARYFLKVDFTNRLRAQRKQQGLSTRYMNALRWETGGMPPEFHYVLSYGPEALEDLKRLWPYGPVIRRTLGEMGPLDKVGRELYRIGLSAVEKGGNAVQRSNRFGEWRTKRRFPSSDELRRRAAM